MLIGDLYDLIAVYAYKNEGAKLKEVDSRTRGEKLDALAMM